MGSLPGRWAPKRKAPAGWEMTWEDADWRSTGAGSPELPGHGRTEQGKAELFLRERTGSGMGGIPGSASPHAPILGRCSHLSTLPCLQTATAPSRSSSPI